MVRKCQREATSCPQGLGGCSVASPHSLQLHATWFLLPTFMGDRELGQLMTLPRRDKMGPGILSVPSVPQKGRAWCPRHAGEVAEEDHPDQGGSCCVKGWSLGEGQPASSGAGGWGVARGPQGSTWDASH